MTVIMPSTPGLGEDVAARKGWAREAARRPEWGLSRPLVSSHGFLSSRGNLAKAAQFTRWRQTGPRETLSKAFLSQNASGLRKGMLHGMHGWAFNPPKSKLISLWERGRWQEKKPKAQDVANIQVGRALLWNEHTGRGMNCRNAVVNETLRFILK